MMRKIGLLACCLVIMATLFASVPTAKAGILESQNLVLTCDTLSGDISFTATRNTTGQGFETFVEEVTDGVNLLSYYTVDVEDGATDSISGTAPLTGAQYSPIIYRLYSPAGNGFPEQTVFTMQVTCPNLISGGACNTPDAGYQAVLTGSAILYWEPGKPTEPNIAITGSNVVMVYSIDDDGWAKIKWACGVYYIKASLLAPNPATVSKPYLSSGRK
ncbi:MAG: hypothetical protein KF726_24990 [Anaerolineae bacterium]|nr:hypothetical protein [Anaerolineae bacterium]